MVGRPARSMRRRRATSSSSRSCSPSRTGRDHALEVLTQPPHRPHPAPAAAPPGASATAAAPTSLAGALVADALVVRAEADLRWLDLCEARLLRAPLQPTTTNGDHRWLITTSPRRPRAARRRQALRLAASPRCEPSPMCRCAVAPGELVAVMGPSGCGKSTMLHLAGGLEDPDAGHVLVDGRDLSAAVGHRAGVAAPHRRRLRVPAPQPRAVAVGARERDAARSSSRASSAREAREAGPGRARVGR